ncbi:MAG: hypothetical protein ACYC4L_02165 [Chloroflexota bacterium]
MSIWDKLGKLLGSGGTRADGGMLYAVKCRRCGEVVKVRADRRFDLEQDFGGPGDEVAGYVLRKEVLGNNCPQLMRLTVHFDRGYREVERDVEGGELVQPDQS